MMQQFDCRRQGRGSSQIYDNSPLKLYNPAEETKRSEWKSCDEEREFHTHTVKATPPRHKLLFLCVGI